MNTDSAYYIGTTHEECQDYAISGKNSIAVSDGCSGSPNSDIGSRVISITAMNKMVEIDSLINFDEKECILLARPAIKMLNIPNECLDATLLTAKAYDTGAMGMCCGDGVIAIKTKDGKTIVINCEYSDNFPFYMNYLYDQTGRYLNWTQNHNKRVITQTVIDPDWFVISNEEVDKPGRLFEDVGIIRLLDNKTIIEITDKDSIEYIAIMSDGVHSFYETITTGTSKFNSALTYIEVLQDLLTFKNFNTSFVQRRMNKFRKKYAKKNCANGDDFSLAVIYLGENKN
jgi:hypothetical protein